jgi:hypothetical protein
VEASADLARIAAVAERFAEPGERVAGIVSAELLTGRRIYLCAFEAPEGLSWLALDEATEPISDRGVVREAASLAALCEVAEESAGGGRLHELQARLAEVQRTEAPAGIEEAAAAAAELARTLEAEPRVASAAYLDAVGAASRRLERALGDAERSPFAAAMQQAMPAVDELAAQVERNYRGRLASDG